MKYKSLWHLNKVITLHIISTRFLSRVIEHKCLSNPWQMSLIGTRTKQSKRENAANISSAITTHTYGLTHWLASGWAIGVFFVFLAISNSDRPISVHPWQMCQLTCTTRQELDSIQNPQRSNAMEKVGTRTLAIQKKKWRGGMFDLRRPELASHRI